MIPFELLLRGTLEGSPSPMLPCRSEARQAACAPDSQEKTVYSRIRILARHTCVADCVLPVFVTIAPDGL
jgi:hypothetical protein